MNDHLGLTGVNQETSTGFYQAVLSDLGYELGRLDESSAGLAHQMPRHSRCMQRKASAH